ncbi:MAG: hypothetical protein GKC10_00025 [Methanosarcinales archaeon]|nr:hypothetical protein [Methanosarcinales archaeon]
MRRKSGMDVRRALLLFLLWAGLVPGSAQANASVQLSYTDGVPEDGLWVDGSRGHAVVFTPPGENWTLDWIGICGKLKGDPGSTFVLEVWDKDLRTLYSSNYSCPAYFDQNLSWTEIDVPDLKVSEDFLVCFFESANVYLGVDLGNQSSGRSILVSREPNRMADWTLRYPQDKTDWLISTSGYSSSRPPTVELALQPSAEGVVFQVNASDEDGDLTDATLHVIDAGSRMVLWSEHRRLNGEVQNLSFLWPRVYYRVTNGTAAFEPLLAVRTGGLSEERSQDRSRQGSEEGSEDGSEEQSAMSPSESHEPSSPALQEASPGWESQKTDEPPSGSSASSQSLLTYSAPCLALVESGSEPLSCLAFFGEDGVFHALSDMSGQLLYQSAQLLKLTSPDVAYGRYSRENLTLKVDESALIFHSMSLDRGMVAGEPLVLTRSPIQHYALKMEKVPAGGEDFTFILEVVDRGGNHVRQTSEAFPLS